jgi:predicted deacetylase
MTTAVATQALPVLAMASAPRDSLVVSVHDVTPSNRTEVDELLRDIAHRGVRVCSLLVVPDYHHQGNFLQDRQFTAWLRDLEGHGHEIVIHGYFHQRPSRPNESVIDKLVTRFYTQREGEFYDLDYAEAYRRINTARKEFLEAGLTPRGFIAPAWLLSAEAEQAVRDAELEYTTRLRTVRDVRHHATFAARSLVYSVHSGWRRAASLAWNSAVREFTRTNPLARVSVHPPDRKYPRVWRHVLDSITSMQRNRTATTYRDWVAEQRVLSRENS